MWHTTSIALRSPVSRGNVSASPESILSERQHRPWPLGPGPWMMFQSWRDLLFAHWKVPPERLRPFVPPPLQLDEREGTAWVALTPFLLTDLRVRGLPPVPGASEFPELNLRTYVTYDGKPGIHFFSLDADSSLAVAGARLFNRLPYHTARMSMKREGDWIRYHSRREDGTGEFAGRYRALGTPAAPTPHTLEAFLVERYALYVVLRSGKVLRTDIHHHPWLLQPAEAEIERNTIPSADGLAPLEGEPLLHFSSRQDTLIWPPKPVDSSAGGAHGRR